MSVAAALVVPGRAADDHGRSVFDIAVAIGHDAGEAQRLLGLLEEDGLAREVERGLWSLTDAAERRYGQPLRDIGTSR